ncbi:MAG: T9SS type A sorting domain-containing protein [Bacteroidota bacterium]
MDNTAQTTSYSLLGKLLLAAFIFILQLSHLRAQPLTAWSKVLGGTSNDIPQTIKLLSDEGFIVVGQSSSSDEDVSANKGGFDAWVTRLDKDGALLWEKNYGGSKEDYVHDVQPTPDGGFILTGGTASDDADLNENKGTVDLWILKIDALGNVQWSKNYGGSGTDVGTSILAETNGYLVVGSTSSAGEPGVAAGYGSNEYWILKIDLNGDLVWEKTYGGKRYDAAKSVVATEDDGYIIAGNSWSKDGDIGNHIGHSDAWLLKIDSEGNILWSKNYGSTTADKLNTLIKTLDGNYAIAGSKSVMNLTGSGFNGRYDEQLWVLKIDPSGTILFEETYGGSQYDEAVAIASSLDGGLILGGWIHSTDGAFADHAGNKDALIIKIDAQGATEWTRQLGGTDNESVKGLLQTPDGGYVMLGYSSSLFVEDLFVKKGFEDWWLVKFNGAIVNVNLGEDLVVCQDEDFTLDAYLPNCDCTYLWDDGNTDSTRTLTLAETTSFSVTVTDETGLEGVDLINVFVSVPEVNIAVIDVPCADFQSGTITLTPVGNAYTYTWNTGSTVNSISNLDGGIYTVTIADGNGCTLLEEIEVTEPLPILIDESITEVDCYENATGSIDLSISGGAGTYTYVWENGATTQDTANLTTGGYVITITDANGCIRVQEFIVNQPPSIDIGVSPIPTSCFDSQDGGADLNINGGVGNFSYEWNNGITTESLLGVAAGTYTITATDGNGCQATEEIIVTSPPEIIIEETIQDASCFGNNDGAIAISIVAGGQGTYQFAWSNNVNTPNISQLSAGTYTLTVTDGNMCEQVEAFIISQNTGIEINEQITPATCYDANDGAIDITLTGASGNVTYAWNNSSTNEDLDELSGGDYILTITDANGCETIELFNIASPDSIEIMASIADVSCFGGDDGWIDPTISGGNGGFTFVWNNANQELINSNLLAGNYALSVTDSEGCSQSMDFVISEPNEIIITPTVTEVSCYDGADGAVDLWVVGGTGGFIYNWDVGANSGLTSGTYTVTVTDVNNCTATETVFIPQPDSLTVDLQITEIVNGDDGKITANVNGGAPPYTYNWNNGTWTEEEITNLSAGTYDLVVTDANGCVITASVLLEPTSIFEIENLRTFEVFPNPNDGTFFLKLEFEKRETIEVSITNKLGQVIQSSQRDTDFILQENTFSHLSSGIYFVVVKTRAGLAVRRLVVQR